MKIGTPKSLTPRSISILISLLGLIMPLVLVVTALYTDQAEKPVYLMFSALSVFVVNYVVVSYILNNFIIKRITPLYGRIDKIDSLEDDAFQMEDRDMIADLDSKVVEWAKRKAKENQQLKENDILRKEFIGNVAHELKTPIFNIQGYIDTLLDGGIHDSEINMRYLERTEKNVNRLITTIKDVDTISRLESGRVMLDYIDFDVVEIINEIFELQDRITKKFNVELQLIAKTPEPIFALADRDKAYEALHNLIVNSVKYGSDGGKSVVSVWQDEERVWIEVKDNGIGIGEQHLPHIFTRFYRVDKSRSRERGGSGLGLAIVKHIVEAHGQKIFVDSKEGEGTTFRLSFQKGKNETEAQ